MDIITSLTTPNEATSNIARRVRELRLARGWSQKELAARAGVKLVTYKFFERTGRISFDRLGCVVGVLGRLDDFDKILRPPTLLSLKQIVEARKKIRQRGRTISK